MSDAAAPAEAAPVEEEAPPPPPPPPKMSEALPFMECPPALDGTMAGDVGFDPLGFTNWIDVRWLREAEIKHGRICQLAIVGFAGTDLGFRLPGEMHQVGFSGRGLMARGRALIGMGVRGATSGGGGAAVERWRSGVTELPTHTQREGTRTRRSENTHWRASQGRPAVHCNASDGAVLAGTWRPSPRQQRWIASTVTAVMVALEAVVPGLVISGSCWRCSWLWRGGGRGRGRGRRQQ